MRELQRIAVVFRCLSSLQLHGLRGLERSGFLKSAAAAASVWERDASSFSAVESDAGVEAEAQKSVDVGVVVDTQEPRGAVEDGGGTEEVGAQTLASDKPKTVLQDKSRYFDGKVIVGKVCNILWKGKWSDATEKSLQDLKTYFSPGVVYEILRCQRDIDVSWSFFMFVSEQCLYKHNSRTYAKMLSLLGDSKRYSRVQTLLDMMQQDGCGMDTQLYNTLISVYGQANMAEKAVATLELFKRGGGKPTTYTYTSMIHLFVKTGNIRKAMEMYSEMVEAHLLPNHTSFNILIDGLAKSGEVSASNS